MSSQKRRRVLWLNLANILIFTLALLIIRRTILWIVVFNTVLCTYLGYRLLRAREPKPKRKEIPLRKFVFLEEDEWLRNTELLKIDPSELEVPCIPESFFVSELLDLLIDLIILEFVDSWFTKVSGDRLFQNSIRLELKAVFAVLISRIAAIDLPKFLVFKFVPIITNHYKQFVATKGAHRHSYSIESKLAFAQQFDKGTLHEGVSLTLPIANSKVKEKVFLRRVVANILPHLLSTRENTNDVVPLLLREILACTVLANVFEVLSEGDFFNQMIVKMIGTNLQHRNQVKMLRAALDQHTRQVAEQMDTKDATLRLPSLKLPLTDAAVLEWSKCIDECNTSNDLDAIGNVLGMLQVAIDATSKYDESNRRLGEIMAKYKEKSNSRSVGTVSLEDILMSTGSSAVFREHLRSEKHESDLDLWRAIDHMRAPLEDSESTNVSLMLEFSNLDDIKNIYDTFFNDSSAFIGPEVRKTVRNYINSCSESSATAEMAFDTYNLARKALFGLQDDLFNHMREFHLPRFEKSNRYGDLDSDVQKAHVRPRRELSVAFRDRVGVPEEPLNDSAKINREVVEAVESAFAHIMTAGTRDDRSLLFSDNGGRPDFSENDSLSATSRTFGNSATLFGSDESKPDRLSSNRLSALFEDISDESDSASINSDSLTLSMELSETKMRALEILLAAPGDLSLAEKIATLDHDIDTLSEQYEILVSLIKKAELTNNVTDLKVLKRSKVSVENEINSKELQKQQYIVQENENSLYGKSKVQIQSCIVGNDRISHYVLYIIEVQKFSSENPEEIVAGWVVARRFSQFYKLNEYLKLRYPDVTQIKFPKKAVPYLGKYLKKQLVEARKPMLESYLQQLLSLPDVCSDPALRSFLSSEDFRIGSGRGSSENNFDVFFNRFYQGVSKTRVPVQSIKSPTSRTSKENEEILENIREMEKELRQFDEIEKNEDGSVPFVKPISDLVMAIFDLSNKSWLRGRALLVILQQVLGSAIEKTIRQQVDKNLKREDKLLDLLNMLTTMLFPNGKFREAPEQRTRSEQNATKQEAFVVLKLFFVETCSKIFGSKNAEIASSNLLEMIQNDYLNKHLMFELLDELLGAVFPESTDASH